MTNPQGIRQITDSEDPGRPVRHGVHTSEFWLAAATVVGAMTAAAAQILPGPWGTAAAILAAGIASAGYSSSRGRVKAAHGGPRGG